MRHYFIHYRENIIGSGRYEVGWWPDREGAEFVCIGVAFDPKGAEEIRQTAERIERGGCGACDHGA